MSEIELRLREPGIVGHYGTRNDQAGILQMVAVPVVGIFAADPCEIRTGALASPLEWLVVHALGGERVVAITFDFITQRTDHLRVAKVATFPHIDVAARGLERR